MTPPTRAGAACELPRGSFLNTKGDPLCFFGKLPHQKCTFLNIRGDPCVLVTFFKKSNFAGVRGGVGGVACASSGSNHPGSGRVEGGGV